MNLIETLRVIWINIMENKFKVLLTSLGIIVGAATIVMVIAIGRGGEAEIAGQFGDLSAATVYVSPDYGKITMGGMDMSRLPKLSEEQTKQIKDENPHIKELMRVAYLYNEVSINNEKDYLQVSAVSPEYSEISNIKTAAGDNISEEDLEGKSRVAVLGDGIAKKYFGNGENAIGQTVKIKNTGYKVVGVLERKGDAIQGMSADDSIFVPYSTAEASGLIKEFDIPQLIGLANDVDSVEKAIARIKSSLNYVLDDGSLYTVDDAGSRIEAATKSATTMKLLLISVAAIVFVVGGIGIMNVLFVSVKERTREIGILKALGGSRKDIMSQFLLESIMISLFGGIAGIALSAILLPLMQYTDIPVLSTPEGMITALFFSILTGTVFGAYPAYKAARLKPIDALNYE